jgi:glutathione peroxidase
VHTGDNQKRQFMRSIYEFDAKTIDGQVQSLSDYKGQVLLIVNVASKCGFTPQYSGLEQIYERFRDQGFRILGFPSNQFLSQEPGSDAEIKNFCSLNYNVTFPMFSKIDMNGANAHPLDRYLTETTPGILGTKAIKWNFTKFLVDRRGQPIKRYAPRQKPEDIVDDIKAALSQR